MQTKTMFDEIKKETNEEICIQENVKLNQNQIINNANGFSIFNEIKSELFDEFANENDVSLTNNNNSLNNQDTLTPSKRKKNNFNFNVKIRKSMRFKNKTNKKSSLWWSKNSTIFNTD